MAGECNPDADMRDVRNLDDQRNHINRRNLLRRTVRTSSRLAAATGLSLFAPHIMRRVYAQAGGVAAIDTIPIWMAVGSVEFLWAVLKARKIDQKHGLNIQ